MANTKRKNRGRSQQPVQHADGSRNVASHEQRIQVEKSGFSGPLPDAEMLAKYASVEETIPNRIVVMAEKNQDHVIDINAKSLALNEKILSGRNAAERRGQWFAFITCLVAVSGGIYIISTGRQISGLILILTTLAGLAYTFVSGRKPKEPEN